nr:c-type cytochrome [Methyloceanibacter stevinii]
MPACRWYTVRQLNNFKTGVRGANPKDTHGQQMAPMAKMLGTDDDVADVAAYIETLK